MMQIQQTNIAITCEDGSVAITALLTAARGSILPSGAKWLWKEQGWWIRPATPEVIESEIAKIVLDSKPVSWRVVDEKEVPSDRSFRGAWTDSGVKIGHDMTKAREIHRTRVRNRRAVAMKDLDGLWMRATGQGDKAGADAIETERQRWRDAPADPRIDAAKTIDDLKGIA